MPVGVKKKKGKIGKVKKLKVMLQKRLKWLKQEMLRRSCNVKLSLPLMALT